MNEQLKQLIESKGDSRLLVEYKGGGYDGCFWEWNYSLLEIKDNSAKYTPIYASGSMGAKDIESFGRRYGQILDGYNPTQNVYFYDIESAESMGEFYAESAPQNVRGAIRWLDENIEWGEFYPDCPICENSISFGADDMVLGDFQGDGGIGVNAHSWHCLECDSLYRCSCCNEFDLTAEYRSESTIDEINDILDENLEDDKICNTCWEYHTGELDEKRVEIEENRGIAQILEYAQKDGVPVSQEFRYYGGLAWQDIRDSSIFATYGASYQDGKYNL